RHRMGYMPQHAHFDPQFPVTVMDIVLMGRLGRRLGGWYATADREAALAALEEVGVADLAKRLFVSLSGGQRQRVLIARALCSEPDLLLFDEPTAHIDALVEAKLFETLQELTERMTVLTVSHDLGFVSSLVKSVVCVNRRVVAHPTSDITGDVIQELYGGDTRIILHDHH
ncbi:MAG: metal ABC transporter ATP-binding protein, partial [Candidatus Tectimicrobiota bacterium]